MRDIGYGLLNSCRVYEKRKQIVEALGYIKKALKIFKKMDEERMIVGAYMHYGIIYKVGKDFEKSSFYFEKAVSILERLGIMYDMGETCFEYASMLKEYNHIAEAKEFFRKSLKVFKKIDAKEYIERVENELKEN